MMDESGTAIETEGLFSKRSSSNILSDPRILEHLRIVAEEAQSLDKEQDAESEFAVTKRELSDKITAYNKRNQLGAFRILLKEDLSFDGALRFYFEDGNEKLTKAVRLTNQTLVSELLPTLIEKFKPDLDQASLVKKAKLYEVHDELEDRAADEICLDPSDNPLDIALNAKRTPRFVLRLEYDRSPNNSESPPINTARQIETYRNNVSSSPVSVRSTESEHSNKASPRFAISPSRDSPTSPPLRPGSSGSDKSRSTPRSALGMFFDGVSGNSSQQDRSAHAYRAVRGKRQRKRSFGSLLKLKKSASNKKTQELSTNTLAPGVLKVFGDHVCPGSNYKSVRATELTTAVDIVREALERYSLKMEPSEYVLCDVIGYFKGSDGSTKISSELDTSEGDSEHWVTEYARVIGDKEKPLVLQQLWKPITGFSRRFELRKKLETEKSSFFQPRMSVAVVKAASTREVNIPSSVQEVRIPDPPPAAINHFQSFCSDASTRPSVVVSPFLPPTDTPFLLLLRGYGIEDDFLYHRLDEQMAVIGASPRVICQHGNRGDQHPDISLVAPDVLPHHCILSKKVETSGNVDLDECEVNFVVYLEPYKDALIRVNGVSVVTPIKLTPGDLVSLGEYYVFMFKDPTHTLDKELKLHWLDVLQKSHALHKDGDYSVVNGDDQTDKIRFPYKVADEERMLQVVMGLVDEDDIYPLTPAYLLLLAVKHSATHHTDTQTRQLLLRIANAIQTIVWEKTSDMSNTIDKDTAPSKALLELLPQLRPVICWMANCLEMLHYLQANLSRYLGNASHLSGGEEALLSADEEMLICLEEVVMYSFQQTVYHLTKVLYVALPVILDTNPFQFEDDDDQAGKHPQEVDMVVGIFNSTHFLLRGCGVHEDISRQLFAYLFFFANASLFNTLMERGAGGKFYRWAKGAQIRGNLDALEAWASQVGLQDEYVHYLQRLSTAVDLLATPKVQLLQADWQTIRRDFPALNAAQVQQILGEYQLGGGKTRPRGWFPPPEEVEPALRTADILLSFVDHPPLSLPTDGYCLDMEDSPDSPDFDRHLAVVMETLGMGHVTTRNWKPHRRYQKTDTEAVISSPQDSQEDDHEAPDVIVSPANPRPLGGTDQPCLKTGRTKAEISNKYLHETDAGMSSPVRATNGRSSAVSERSPNVTSHKDHSSAFCERSPNVTSHKDHSSALSERSPNITSQKSHTSADSTPARSPPGSINGSPGRSGSMTSSVSSLSSSGTRDGIRDDNHNVASRVAQKENDDGSKWVEVNGSAGSDTPSGLSVLPFEDDNKDSGSQSIDATPIMDQLFKIQRGAHVTGSDVEYKLEGMRAGDDTQDDVFIVELHRTESSIGLGLIDGLYTPLRSPGIYVKTLVPGGPAMKDGRLRLGDRILAVNGTSLVGADYQSAMQHIRQAGQHLSFLVAKSDIHVAMKITASSC